jgi:DNA topoisomerase IA
MLLDLQGPNQARKGVDAGDHPPITPVGLPTYALSGDESRIYDLIVRHFLATISKDAKYLVTKAVFISPSQGGMEGGETFTCRGKEEIDPGFTRVYGRDDHDAEEYLGEVGGGLDSEAEGERGGEQRLPSQLERGMLCRVSAAKLRKGMTTVPG